MPFLSFDVSECDLDPLHENVFKHTVAELLHSTSQLLKTSKKIQFHLIFDVFSLLAITGRG